MHLPIYLLFFSRIVGGSVAVEGSVPWQACGLKLLKRELYFILSLKTSMDPRFFKFLNRKGALDLPMYDANIALKRVPDIFMV
jgi:hypothetical protein